MKKTSKVKNPIAKVVRTIKPRIVAAKKGKGSYKRRGKYIEEKNQCMNTEQKWLK